MNIITIPVKMNLFFYPNTTRKNTATRDPYTNNLTDALTSAFTIINQDDASSVGILKTAKYLFWSETSLTKGTPDESILVP
jgi:hypothetical protein